MDGNRSNGVAIWSVILGLAGIACGFLTFAFLSGFVIGIILGIVAIVMAIVARRQSGGGGAQTAGLIFGILAIIVSIIIAVLEIMGIFAVALSSM